MKNSKRKMLTLFLIAGMVASLIAAILFLRASPPDELNLAIKALIHDFFFAGIGLGLFIFMCGVAFLALRVLDTSAIRTAIRLASNKISAKIRTQNAAQISPCLQYFFYGILRQNKDTLGIQVGQDASCLTPIGFNINFRKGCVFYGFCLIAPNPPDLDCGTLRQILQQYIWSELINYGIAGLPSVYQDPVHGATPTVYLDRMRYNEQQHLLQFSLLYISTPEAAKYAWEAAGNRDKGKVEAEPEVYDDQI